MKEKMKTNQERMEAKLEANDEKEEILLKMWTRQEEIEACHEEMISMWEASLKKYVGKSRRNEVRNEEAAVDNIGEREDRYEDGHLDVGRH
jgi:hypothetical protein